MIIIVWVLISCIVILLIFNIRLLFLLKEIKIKYDEIFNAFSENEVTFHKLYTLCKQQMKYKADLHLKIMAIRDKYFINKK